MLWVSVMVGLLALALSVGAMRRGRAMAGICSCHNPVRWWIYRSVGVRL